MYASLYSCQSSCYVALLRRFYFFLHLVKQPSLVVDVHRCHGPVSGGKEGSIQLGKALSSYCVGHPVQISPSTMQGDTINPSDGDAQMAPMPPGTVQAFAGPADPSSGASASSGAISGADFAASVGGGNSNSGSDNSRSSSGQNASGQEGGNTSESPQEYATFVPNPPPTDNPSSAGTADSSSRQGNSDQGTLARLSEKRRESEIEFPTPSRESQSRMAFELLETGFCSDSYVLPRRKCNVDARFVLRNC